MFKIVVIAASTGSLRPLQRLFGELPAALQAAIFIVRHIGKSPSVLPDILRRASKLKAAFAEEGEAIVPGRAYVAPPDHHMVIGDGQVHINRAAKVHHARPAADPLFFSAAEVYGDRVIAIVLSGHGSDGAAGLAMIKKRGGSCLIQDPAHADAWSMPFAALVADGPDVFVKIEDMAHRVVTLCGTGLPEPSIPAGVQSVQ